MAYWFVLFAIGAILVLFLFLVKRAGEPFGAFFVGVVTFFFVTRILEGLFFATIRAISPGFEPQFLMSKIFFYSLSPAVFEETAKVIVVIAIVRLLGGCRGVLSFGLGYAYSEVALSLVPYVFMPILANIGTGASFVEATATIGFAGVAITLFERSYVVIAQLALIAIVYGAVAARRVEIFLLAVLLHAIFDVGASLYQLKLLSLLSAEVYGVVGAAFLTFMAVLVHRSGIQQIEGHCGIDRRSVNE